jgi:hypothetical protein
LGHDDIDRPLYEAAFARAEMDIDHCVWWDSDVRWDSYDLVVIRSTWDYVPRIDEYRQWLSSMDAFGTLRNPASLVTWNLDKRYLMGLGSAGVPVIPTRVASSSKELIDCLSPGDQEVVVKPVVSAGSVDTGRFVASDPNATDLGRHILRNGMSVMVQPAIRSVATEGEISAVLFGGRLSHAFRKGPMLALGGERLDGYKGLEAVVLTSEQDHVVRRAMETVSRIAVDELGVSAPLLYARVDLVRLEDGRHVVLEVELNEPSFFLTVDADAAGRFAGAVQREVDG